MRKQDHAVRPSWSSRPLPVAVYMSTQPISRPPARRQRHVRGRKFPVSFGGSSITQLFFRARASCGFHDAPELQDGLPVSVEPYRMPERSGSGDHVRLSPRGRYDRDSSTISVDFCRRARDGAGNRTNRGTRGRGARRTTVACGGNSRPVPRPRCRSSTRGEGCKP